MGLRNQKIKVKIKFFPFCILGTATYLFKKFSRAPCRAQKSNNQTIKVNFSPFCILQYNTTTSEVHPTKMRWNLYHMTVFRSGVDLLATIIIPGSLLGMYTIIRHAI